MTGKLYGVSVGPGNPQLMTLSAVKTIEKCSFIAAPQSNDGKMSALSIASQVVDVSEKKIIPLRFLMTRDKELQQKRHKEIAEQIAQYLIKGKDVALLNIGDISIYSTFSYIAELIGKMGFEIEIIAGVPSFCAAAAVLKISLTNEIKPLIIIPAQCEYTTELLNLDGSKVVMKSGKSFPEIKSMLLEQNNIDKIHAVECCGLPGQKVYCDISSVDECGYFTTIIVEA